MRRQAESKRTAHTPEELRALDDEFDRYRGDSESIGMEQLGEVLKQLGLSLTPHELEDVMESFDEDGNGELGRSEFRQIMSLKMTAADVKEAFSAVDSDSSGSLTREEFLSLAMGMGYDAQEADQLVLQSQAPSPSNPKEEQLIHLEHFQNILTASAAFRVRLGILAQVGALWALARTNQGQQDHSDIRYREVSKMLEAEAESVRAQAEADLAGGAAGGGHGHGDCPPGEHPHIFPLHKMKPWKQGDDFLHRCRVGVLQYVAWQSFSALFAFIMEKNHNFHEGSFSPSHGYIYVLVIKSFSQAWALYCLVYFEHSCAKLLEPVKPMPKFWSIKLVVMATFWQSVTISILTKLDMMPWETFYDQCYVNAADGGLDQMLSPHGIGNGTACVDDPVCRTGPYSEIFSVYGAEPCISGVGRVTDEHWNKTVRLDVETRLQTKLEELDVLCSQSCLSSDFCKNTLDKCHPWCTEFTPHNIFPFCTMVAEADRRSADSTPFAYDFCADDHGDEEGEEGEGGSVCLSTYQDDIGNYEKFAEKANVQLQNLLVCVEMFIAAMAHRTVFSYRDYKSGTKKTAIAGLRDMVPKEVLRDVRNLTSKATHKHLTTIAGATIADAVDGIADTVIGGVGGVVDGVAEVVGDVADAAVGLPTALSTDRLSRSSRSLVGGEPEPEPEPAGGE